MARLRFPGRPGYRFGRLGLTYSRDEPSENLDKATKFIANIHKGLRYFHEIFGESDEDVSTEIVIMESQYSMICD